MLSLRDLALCNTQKHITTNKRLVSKIKNFKKEINILIEKMAKNTNKYFTQCQYRKFELIRNQRNTNEIKWDMLLFFKESKQEICSHSWQIIWHFLVSLNIYISWLVISPLAAHPRESFAYVCCETYTNKAHCTSV